MPYLTTVSPSTTMQVSTGIHYHTTLTAVWKSDYVYDVTLSITREENSSQGTVAWNVTNSHGYRLKYYDTSGNLVDTGNTSLAGTNVKIVVNGVEGAAGWPDRTATIITWQNLAVHSTKRRVVAQYYATLDNTSLGGTYETLSFWSPSENIDSAPLLPDGPNVYVRSSGAWKRAKDIYVYKNGVWTMAPNGDMCVRSGSTWKS